jgi:ribosomal protein L32
MEVAELQEKIRKVYKLINYQNIEFEYNEQLRQARKILNEIQSKLNQPTVISTVCVSCDEQKETHELCMDCVKKMIKENQQTDL